MAKKETTKKVIKSADDGKFVSKKYAENHPNTTYKQTVTKSSKKK